MTPYDSIYAILSFISFVVLLLLAFLRKWELEYTKFWLIVASVVSLVLFILCYIIAITPDPSKPAFTDKTQEERQKEIDFLISLRNISFGILVFICCIWIIGPILTKKFMPDVYNQYLNDDNTPSSPRTPTYEERRQIKSFR
jgi:hypothetical protein